MSEELERKDGLNCVYGTCKMRPPDENEVRTALIKAWHIAKDSCLVPPDGGSPTEEEIAVSARAANGIRALMPNSKLPILVDAPIKAARHE